MKTSKIIGLVISLLVVMSSSVLAQGVYGLNRMQVDSRNFMVETPGSNMMVMSDIDRSMSMGRMVRYQTYVGSDYRTTVSSESVSLKVLDRSGPLSTSVRLTGSVNSRCEAWKRTLSLQGQCGPLEYWVEQARKYNCVVSAQEVEVLRKVRSQQSGKVCYPAWVTF